MGSGVCAQTSVELGGSDGVRAQGAGLDLVSLISGGLDTSNELILSFLDGNLQVHEIIPLVKLIW